MGFCLQNVPGFEVEQVQVRRIWRLIHQKPEFRQRPLSDLGGVGRRKIRKKTYFMSGYVLRLGGDHMLSQKLLVNDGVFTFAGENRPSAAKIR